MIAGCARGPAPPAAGESAVKTEAVAPAKHEPQPESNPSANEPDARATTKHTDCDVRQPRGPVHADPRRLIVLTAAGPLIVHLQIFVDGQPQREAIERVLDEAARLAAGESADAGGLPDWAALVERPLFASGILGNAPLGDARARGRAAEQFDANRDRRVQREELAAFLAQDAARGRPFTVDWVVGQQAGPKRNAPLMVLLDADEDGRLSTQEIAAAPLRLRSRDVDDNDAVLMADFRPPSLADQPARYRRDERPTRAFELQRFSLDSIYYTLSDLYESGGLIGPASFPLAPRLLAELDGDLDGLITQRELAGLIAARSDLTMKVDYCSSNSDRAPPALEVVATGGELAVAEVTINRMPARLTIDLPGAQLDILAADVAHDAERSAAASSLFASTDADGNQYLDARELTGLGELTFPSLENLDDNKDGQIALDEFERAVVARVNYRDLQVRVGVSEAADPLFSWLDVRSDGRLTTRELSGAGERLARLDANGDGIITPAEIPDRLTCSIERGRRSTAADSMPQPISPDPLADSAAGAVPWLAAMDVNGDGEVSRREFLGTTPQFAALDSDGDGFIDDAEGREAARE